MIRYELNGKAAIVTGAASGIGLATATILARSGAEVALNYLPDDPRGPDQIEKLKAEGLKVIPAPGNVGDADQAVAMVNRAIDRLGRLDLLVNNAGTPGVRKTVDMARLDLVTEELWATILATNLLGPFRCSKAAAPALKAARGAIVNTASIAGTGSGGSSMPYGASKAALVNLTKNLARGLAPEVRVNAVAPGGVDFLVADRMDRGAAPRLDRALAPKETRRPGGDRRPHRLSGLRRVDGDGPDGDLRRRTDAISPLSQPPRQPCSRGLVEV